MSSLGQKCSLCNQTAGASVGCDMNGCTNRFHLSCAAKSDLISDQATMDKESKDASGNLGLFCKPHLLVGRKSIKTLGLHVTKFGVNSPVKQFNSDSLDSVEELEEVAPPRSRTKFISRKKIAKERDPVVIERPPKISNSTR